MPAGPSDPSSPRVGLVTTSFPLTAGSMSGIFVRRLADALAERVRLRVLVPDGTEPPEGGLEARRDLPFDLQPFRYAPRRWQRLTHRPGGLPAALARRDPALVLVPALVAGLYLACRRAAGQVHLIHANWSVVGAVAVAAVRGRVPVVTTLRGSDVTRAEGSALDRWWLLRAVAGSAAVTTVSPGLLERVRHLLPQLETPLVAVPNGVDQACFAAAGRRPAERAGPLRLLGVGNLVDQKDVGTVLRALARLPADVDWRLRWLGGGPLRPDLERLAAELGIGERVALVGPVAPPEVPDHLSEADVFVFSSRGEGRPNALLEALAAGLPAVVPRVPGVVGLVEDDREALFYPAGDPAGLAERLEVLCRRAELRLRLGESGRRRLLREGLTWEAAALRYEELYRRVLPGPPPGGSG